MSRLSKEQIREQRASFEEWQHPAAMLSRSERLMTYMGGEDLFNQPGIDFIREGWAAAKLGLARAAGAVRLTESRQSWPDFELQANGVVERWECTEADVPGRRRGQEYRKDALMAGDRALGLDHPSNYIARIERAPGAIRARCEAKAAKRYAGAASLLIYLNISGFGARHRETLDSFGEATAPAKAVFTEVWVLWKDRAYAVWRNGEPVGG